MNIVFSECSETGLHLKKLDEQQLQFMKLTKLQNYG